MCTFSSFYVHTIPRDDGQDSEVAVLIEFSVVEVKDYADSWAGSNYVSFLFVSISLCLCIHWNDENIKSTGKQCTLLSFVFIAYLVVSEYH